MGYRSCYSHFFHCRHYLNLIPNPHLFCLPHCFFHFLPHRVNPLQLSVFHLQICQQYLQHIRKSCKRFAKFIWMTFNLPWGDCCLLWIFEKQETTVAVEVDAVFDGMVLMDRRPVSQHRLVICFWALEHETSPFSFAYNIISYLQTEQWNLQLDGSFPWKGINVEHIALVTEKHINSRQQQIIIVLVIAQFKNYLQLLKIHYQRLNQAVAGLWKHEFDVLTIASSFVPGQWC